MLAKILEEHAQALEKIGKIRVRPAGFDLKYYSALFKGIEPVTPPDPKRLAEALKELAERMREGRVNVYELENDAPHLIKITKQHEARYIGGTLIHGEVHSPFGEYEDKSVHIVTDGGYVKGVPGKEGFEYKFRPTEKYLGVDRHVVFVRHEGRTYVINPHAVHVRKRPI